MIHFDRDHRLDGSILHFHHRRISSGICFLDDPTYGRLIRKEIGNTHSWALIISAQEKRSEKQNSDHHTY